MFNKMLPQGLIHIIPCNVQTHYTMKGRIGKELKYITIIHCIKRDIAIPFFLSGKHKRFINKTSSEEKQSKIFFMKREITKIPLAIHV